MDSKPLVIADLNPPLNITLVTDNAGLEKVADFFTRCDLFGFDTETNVVETLSERKLRTIQVGNRQEQYVIDLLAFAGSKEAMMQQGDKTCPEWARTLSDVLAKGLESKAHLKVGVYLQFDYEIVRWCLGLRTRHLFDCNLAEKVIHCGRVNFFTDDFYGMTGLLPRYCGLKVDKTLQTSFDLETPLTQDQIEYAALDTRMPLSVRNAQLPILSKAGLQLTTDIENGAIMGFGDMHINGMFLDSDMWMAQVEAVKVEHSKHITEMDKYFIPVVGDKTCPVGQPNLDKLEAAWRDCKDKEERKRHRRAFELERKKLSDWQKALKTWIGEAAINYGSNDQMLAALHKMGLKIKSTNDKVLDMHAGVPVVDAIREYRSTCQLLKTYGLTFLRHIDPITGRIHSSISQLGAETGRTTSSSPNVQNIPKGSAYRNCFRARTGYKFIGKDYDGCELRIMAEESGEEVWIDAFNAGQDVHSICAALMFADWDGASEPGCKYVTDKQKCKCPKHVALRDNAKAVNFGIPYGMEAGALGRKLRISKEEAQKLLDLHALKFPKVHAYLKKIGEFAKQNLEARTKAGRRRLFDKPDWAECKKQAIERAVADGRSPSSVTSKDVGRFYYGKIGSIEREGKNSPIQGLNADMVKLAIGLAWEDLEPVYGGLLLNVVHDEILQEAPEAAAQAASDFMGLKMEEAGAFFVKRMAMTSAGAIADCWQKG